MRRAMPLTIKRSHLYGRHLLITGAKKSPEEMEVLVNYTGEANTSKAIVLDNEVIPLLVGAAELRDVLEAGLVVPTMHICGAGGADPKDCPRCQWVAKARKALDKTRSTY